MWFYLNLSNIEKKMYLNVIHQGRCCVNTLTVAPSQELSKRMEPKVHIIIMTGYNTIN
jgi:hypothetical protein